MGVGALRFLSLPLAFLASIVLARGLGPAGYGRYAFVMAVATLLAIPISRGLPQLLTREVSLYAQGEQWGLFRGLLRRAHQWVAVGCVILGGSVAALAVSRATWSIDDRWTLLLIGLILLPLIGLNAVRTGALSGLGRVVVAQLPEALVAPGFHLVALLLLILLGLLNTATALGSMTLATAAAFLVGAGLLRRARPPELDWARTAYRDAQWARAWLPFTLLIAASVLNAELGILLLGWLGTDEQIGALRVADRGAQMVALSLGVVNSVIAPHIARAHREGAQHRLQVLSRNSARGALLFAVPIALPMILFGAPIIRVLFGTEYVALGVVPLALLAGAQLVNVAFGSVGTFLTMSGYERDTLLGQAIALAVNAGSGLILIPRFGASGAAAAAAAGLVTWNVALGLQFVRRLGLRPGAL